jgi:hypothetical protein
MAQVSGTVDTLDIVGIAEDIEDVIYDISPEDTPVLSMAKRVSVTNTLHQWQTDSLAAVTANRQVEGDDASYTTASPTVLLSNYCQISRKTLIVSETSDVVRKYGRAKELARLTTKYGKELKRDMEQALAQNQASSAGGSSTARSSAGLESMIVNRVVATGNTTGTTPGYASGVWAAPTDGTATVTLSETHIQDALELAWTDGGDPSIIMCGPYQKRKIAAFSGANKYAGFYNDSAKAAQGAIIGGVDIYISDFGEHKIKLNRFMRTRTVLCLDPEYVSLGVLRPIKLTELAKTGDANKRMLINEYCLVVGNPDAHAKVADLPVA